MQFEIYRDENDVIRWRLVDSQKRAVAVSDKGYPDVNTAKLDVENVRGGAAQANVKVSA